LNNPSTYSAWGYQHANYLNGPLTYGVGAYQINDYGVWVVVGPLDAKWTHPKGYEGVPASVFSEAQASTTLPSVLAIQMRQSRGVVSGDWQDVTEANVGNLDGEQRFAAEYSLKALPRGALVRAELLMHGHSASGETPTTTINVYRGTGLFATGHSQWAPAALTPPIKWDFHSIARLEIEASVARNAYNSDDILGLHFAYGGTRGAVAFEVPSLVITFVPQDNLLTGPRRHLTITECGAI
jgi:hypothetical protein